MAQKFMALVGGVKRLIEGLVSSAGAADAGKIPALGADGRLSMTMMPAGVGANSQPATATEAIGAGKFVNFHDNGGTFSMRLADNSNGRRADGFVLVAVANAAVGEVYPLDQINSALTGLTVGSDYWLGTAGGVVTPALDETNAGNAGKLSQYLGYAKSATELVTTDSDVVTL
jgi:hypothetical protein